MAGWGRTPARGTNVPDAGYADCIVCILCKTCRRGKRARTFYRPSRSRRCSASTSQPCTAWPPTIASPLLRSGASGASPLAPSAAFLAGAGVGHLADGPLDPGAATAAKAAATTRSDAIQPILDLSASLLGVMMVSTDMDGNPLTGVANPCPWFVERGDDPEVLGACIQDWKGLAADLDFEPRLAPGSHGFECARAYIRDGDRLVGMVLAGGIAPADAPAAGLYSLDDEGRAAVIAALPRVASTISRVLSGPANPTATNRSTP